MEIPMTSKQQNNLQNNMKLPSPFLTGYFVCGHPRREKSVELIVAAVDAGLDAIEIGIPSQNPYLDGEIIQRGHEQVLSNFQNEEDYLSFLIELREKISVPIWIMGYYRDLIKTNLYIKLSTSNFIDGFIIPDLNINDLPLIKKTLDKLNVMLIPIINQSMSDEELQRYIEGSNLLYCQLHQGKTGKAISDFSSLPDFYQRVRNLTDATLMGGFGIKNGELARQVYSLGYDGVVVGSKIVSIVEKGDKEELVNFIQELAAAKMREIE